MLGAIAGDVIGSPYEGGLIKTKEFPLFGDHSVFTDDTVLTVAVGDAIMTGRGYGSAIREFGLRYPDAGYGGLFRRWLLDESALPYGSWGNGSAMRVSPIGFAFNSVELVLEQAELSAAVTHNHPEGIKGAQAVALAVFLARTGATKEEIKTEIGRRFEYDLDRTLDQIRPVYSFDVSCKGSVPESIIAFLESEDFEDAIRNAVSLGGDSDTMACISGAVAQAHYRAIPDSIIAGVRNRLPNDLLTVVDEFDERLGESGSAQAHRTG